MDARRRLAANLQSEATAYGYTLTVWGAGALLIAAYGTPAPLEVFLYVGGALGGFALLTLVAFPGPLSSADCEPRSNMVALSTVHLLATLGNLTLVYALVTGLDGTGLGATATFPLIGFGATVAYNLVMLLEQGLSEWLPSVTGSDPWRPRRGVYILLA